MVQARSQAADEKDESSFAKRKRALFPMQFESAGAGWRRL